MFILEVKEVVWRFEVFWTQIKCQQDASKAFSGEVRSASKRFYCRSVFWPLSKKASSWNNASAHLSNVKLLLVTSCDIEVVGGMPWASAAAQYETGRRRGTQRPSGI